MNQAKRLRVLMLVENLPYPKDYRVRQEANSLFKAGYQVFVISPSIVGQPWREYIDGVLVFRYPSPPESNGFIGYLWEYSYSSLATFALSLLVCFRPGFDIIHAANPPDILFFIAIFYKMIGKRFIFDHHDLAPELYNARYGGKGHTIVYGLLVWLEKLSCRFADHVIATNQSYKTIEIQRGHVPPDRITVVRNGPDDLPCQIEPAPGLRHQGKITIVYLGVIGNQDGVDHLIRALDYCVYKLGRIDIICIIVGDGDALPTLKSMSEDLELTNFVLFAGWVDHTEVSHYLSAADICVAPEPSNPYNDRSTMIKIMEYMAMGKPIVAFDLPEHRITAEGAALYAHPNDDLDFARKITELMDNPKQRRIMGQLGRERVEKELAWLHQKEYLLLAYSKVAAA